MAKKNILNLKGVIIKLAVSFILLISVTTAWFIFAQDANVDTLDMDVSKATSVSVSSGGEWSQKLEITHESEGAVKITEYSGNGKNLFGPVIVGKQVTSFYTIDETSANNGYIDFTLKFKADGPVDVYLGDESVLIPESYDGNLNNNGVSKNYIVGSVRLAMWCVETDAEPFIWVPNASFEYNPNTKKMSQNGTVEDAYQYATDTTVENIHTVQTNGAASGAADNGMFVWGNVGDVSISDMSPIITLDPAGNAEDIKTLNVRVWVEGTDREAVKDFIGGRFKIKLNFKSVSKEGGAAE